MWFRLSDNLLFEGINKFVLLDSTTMLKSNFDRIFKLLKRNNLSMDESFPK